MKKLIITVIILFLHLLLFSQDQNEEKRLSKSISINLKQVDFQSNRTTYDDLNSSFGIDFQGSYYYKINNFMELRTGVELSYLTSNSKDYSLIFTCDFLGVNGFDEKNSYVESTLNWFYANIPIELQFTIFDEGKRIYLKGGLDNLFHIFGDSKSFLIECGTDRREVSGFTFDPKTFFGQVNFGFGLEFNINSKAKFFIEPNMEYSFSNVMDIPTVIGETAKSRILNVGIQSGIRF